MLISNDFYCHQLNLFTPDPHISPYVGCCVLCLVEIDPEFYQEHCWYPSNAAKISFKIDYDDWIEWTRIEEIKPKIILNHLSGE